jgi:superfamily II DNA/RNA helicase
MSDHCGVVWRLALLCFCVACLFTRSLNVCSSFGDMSTADRFLLLFTFLKKNLKKKVIVFFSTCNAVKFYAELLNYIDIPVLELHVRSLTM